MYPDAVSVQMESLSTEQSVADMEICPFTKFNAPPERPDESINLPVKIPPYHLKGTQKLLT